jgi:hypothetical protein
MFFHGGHVVPGELRRLKALLGQSRAPGYAKFVDELRRELGDVLGRSSVHTVADVDHLFNLGADVRTVWPEGLELFDADTTRYVHSKYGPTSKAAAISFLWGFHGKSLDETVANLVEQTDFRPDMPTRPEERVAGPPQADAAAEASNPTASGDLPDEEMKASGEAGESGRKQA